MQDHPWVHLAWISSHFLRTFLEERRLKELSERLTNEVAILQAEIHRTSRILSGYSELADRCETSQGTRLQGNLVFLVVVVVLGLLLVGSWIRSSRPTPTEVLAVRDTGGSSDSDEPLPAPKPVVPLRPSQLGGKGKKGLT